MQVSGFEEELIPLRFLVLANSFLKKKQMFSAWFWSGVEGLMKWRATRICSGSIVTLHACLLESYPGSGWFCFLLGAYEDIPTERWPEASAHHLLPTFSWQKESHQRFMTKNCIQVPCDVRMVNVSRAFFPQARPHLLRRVSAGESGFIEKSTTSFERTSSRKTGKSVFLLPLSSHHFFSDPHLHLHSTISLALYFKNFVVECASFYLRAIGEAFVEPFHHLSYTIAIITVSRKLMPRLETEFLINTTKKWK